MKNQKPIDYDIHLKYSCPKCGQYHWLSFKEASTKNFKVVCDCDEVFKVKRVKSFKIKYETKSIVQSSDKDNLSSQTIKTCVKTLEQYGFSSEEAKDLIIETYKETKICDVGNLIKQALTKFGVKNGI
jgi:phage terminase large subunit GpA-like protein